MKPAEEIVTAAARPGTVDEALNVPHSAALQTGQSPAVRDAARSFLIRASSDMLRRMADGLRRGWGDGWKRAYSDDEVAERLGKAVGELLLVLGHYRGESVGIDELRKRAADVANQAFMLADPERLRNNVP